ncbi:MAG: rod shape-determining protein MreC [Magnetospiraceae bacterium]
MKQRHGAGHGTAATLKAAAHRFAYVGLLLFSVALMLVSRADTIVMERIRTQIADVAVPFLNILSSPLETVESLRLQFDELRNLQAENARLREENTRLLHWQAVGRKTQAENLRLRALSKLAVPQEKTFVSARVVADTGGTFLHSVLITAGELDGIEKGMAVMAPEGMVGRIATVGKSSSRVLLVTDLNSRIPVLIGENRVRAILAGTNTESPRLMHLPSNAKIEPGERVITSGHGGALPPGLSIGVVAHVADDLVQVQPFMDRTRLDYLRTVQYEHARTAQPKPSKDLEEE